MNSFLLKVQKWSCMFQTEYTTGKVTRQPNFIDFTFVYEKPYYRIEMRPQGTQVIKTLEKLLPKYSNDREIKLENDFIQVEIIKHEAYQIDSVKLIWIEADTVAVFD